jgi:hypothetical protein
MTHLSRLVLALLAAVATQLAWGAAEPPGPTDIKPGPAVAQIATEHGLPVDGFELAGTPEPGTPGDRVTVLFTIMEGGKSRQWLSEFSSVSLTAREAKSKPDAGLGILSWLLRSLKTDTGHEFSFSQSPAALVIRTFGPFDGSNKTDAVTTHVLATREYLEHGLAQMCEIETRLHEAGLADPHVSFLSNPSYSKEQIAATKQRASAANFTEEDERAFAEGYLALVQFLAMAFKTPGTDAFMGEMFDQPSIFSGGSYIIPDWSKLQLLDGSDWGLPTARVFRVPYYLQSKTKAGGFLFLTAPRPPLQNTAGIVGLTVDWSSTAPGKRLIARVLAGQRGRP